ncbi:MAG: NusG domain II-containing protein [Lachnospira sp.]
MKCKNKEMQRAVILCAIIFLLVLGSIASIFLVKTRNDGKLMAYIYRDNEIIYTVNLSEVKESYRVTFEYNDGDYNVVEIRPGSIGIVEATCPDHLCMNMGFISDELMPVTCLPNHLVIRVQYEGGDDNDNTGNGLDGIAY